MSGHVSLMGEIRIVHRISVRIPEEKENFGDI
jgi:predicted ATP-dependent serine protease